MIGSWFAVVLQAALAAQAGTDLDRAQPPPAPSLLAPIGPHPVARPDIDLKDAKDGSGDLLYQGTGFSARVARDGTVTFSDKNVTGLSPVPWFPMKTRMPVPSLQSSLVSLLKGKKPPKPPPSELDVGLAPPETKQLIPDVSRYRPDPREDCRECSFNSLAIPIQGFARADVTDQLERLSGQDPQRYQKAVFLAATYDRRVQMAARAHAADVRRASDELPGHLQAIACDERLTHKERRAIIAALGREMDGTTAEGQSAARSITAFLARFDAGRVSCSF